MYEPTGASYNTIQYNASPISKFATGLNTKIGIVQIACIRVIKLSSRQNDPPMGESFWQKNSLITFILFELSLFWYLAQLQI